MSKAAEIFSLVFSLTIVSIPQFVFSIAIYLTSDTPFLIILQIVIVLYPSSFLPCINYSNLYFFPFTHVELERCLRQKIHRHSLSLFQNSSCHIHIFRSGNLQISIFTPSQFHRFSQGLYN